MFSFMWVVHVYPWSRIRGSNSGINLWVEAGTSSPHIGEIG
jgi:hypothetical protein